MDNGHFWHAHSIEEVCEKLHTSLEKGLSRKEAKVRLERHGLNELQERPRPGLWQIFLAQFNNFLVLILLAASVVSFFLGEYLDAGAIMAIVFLNAVLGTMQEHRAEEALAALKRMSVPEVKALRDGHFVTVPAKEIVPGDVVLLESGNYVPADVRLSESFNLRIDEAPLTGESMPVAKRAEVVLDEKTPVSERYNMAYMGTLVTYGRGKGIVVATGMDTQMGLIAEMIQAYEDEPTPLQVKLDELGKVLGVLTLAICGVVFAVGVWRDTGIGLAFQDGFLAYLKAFRHELVEMFMTAVSLAIAAVPEGLPAVVTICLALGLQKMARRHALIRRLPAVETLGSATIICSDKTGTLTRNEMTVVQIYADDTLIHVTGEGYEPKGSFQVDHQPIDLDAYPEARYLLLSALLCNDAYLEVDEEEGQRTWRIVGDPTEGALIVAAAKAGMWKEEAERRWPRVGEIPFDPQRKRMSTIHKVNSSPPFHESDKPYVVCVKGAPDIILELCAFIARDGRVRPLTQDDKEDILGSNEALATNALRVLGVAYRTLEHVSQEPSPDEVERDLVFLGLIGMIDPARPEVKPAIEKARAAGIKTVMITGDHRNTAEAIAREIGLLPPHEQSVLSGTELDGLDDEEFERRVESIRVYARVSPQHKVRIVEALKRKGHVVAMTGDGINDAPALRRADIGVAMGITGTDVSKETSDMVLTDDNYASIVAAIEEGRVIYSNIRKFVYYLLSCNVGEILIVFFAMLMGLPLPLTAIQLLWLNLLTDGAPALALGLEKGDPDVMKRPPRPPKEPLINQEMRLGIIIQSVFITTATLAAFILGLRQFSQEVARTIAFSTLVLSELLRAYTSRSEHFSIFSIGPFSNRFMQWAVGLSLLLLLTVIYIPFLNPVFDTAPLGLAEWALVLLFIPLPAVAAELTKPFLRQMASHYQARPAS